MKNLPIILILLASFLCLIQCGGGSRNAPKKFQGYCASNLDPIPLEGNLPVSSKKVAQKYEDVALIEGDYTYESSSFFYKYTALDQVRQEIQAKGEPIPADPELMALAAQNGMDDILVYLEGTRDLVKRNRTEEQNKKIEKEQLPEPNLVKTCLRGFSRSTKPFSRQSEAVTEFSVNDKNEIVGIKKGSYLFDFMGDFFTRTFTEVTLDDGETSPKKIHKNFTSSFLYKIEPATSGAPTFYELRSITETEKGEKIFLSIIYKFTSSVPLYRFNPPELTPILEEEVEPTEETRGETPE